jgi:hypothetical protein
MTPNSEIVWLDDVVRDAMANDKDVRLELDDEYGFHVVIEGERVTDFLSEGMAWETLTLEIPPSVRL